jgi:GNAT superfamily N-acetyltransferase
VTATAPIVRRARGRDAATLVPLCIEHAAYERIDCRLGGHGAALALALDGPSPPLHAWLAWIGDEPAGYATATIDFATLDGARFLHMDCLYVRAPWRGRGTGMQLFEAVRAFARTCDCAAMQWQTPAWNEDAARFYRRLGAHEKLKRRFTLPLGD